MSDTFSFQEAPHPTDVSIPHSSINGSFGGAEVGVFKSSSTLFELINLWQVKFLSRDARGTTGVLSTRAMKLSSLALFDDCKGYAWLSSMAGYYNALTGNNTMTQIQMESHAQAVSNLREKFEHNSMSLPLLASLNSLISAEFAAGDYSTAAHHTKFLADELDPRTTVHGGPLVHRIRHTVIILELERSMASFSRPLFDLNAWIAHDQSQDLKASRTQASSIFFPPYAPSGFDHEALSDVRLVDVFTRMRHFDQILDQLALADTVGRSAAFQISWTALQLGNDILLHSLDLCATASQYSIPASKFFNEEQLRHLRRSQYAAASLALMFYFRFRTRSEHGGVESTNSLALLERFWSIGPSIAKRMETLMRHSQGSADLLVLHSQTYHAPSDCNCPDDDIAQIPKDVDPIIRLRLWVLYIGKCIEATARRGQRVRTSYFDDALSNLCDGTFDVWLNATDRRQALDRIVAGFFSVEHMAPLDGRSNIFLKQGPEWLSPALRTWGFANWDGELA
ncbi:uncharacterized protein AB675_8372 [Cyphellophora attinorum]|uniref:Transcription factor domain-containing protein n=1 Tax=Cyphellophora attinorum TaxID=1664694 RepID=A0A0N1P3S6_9EURO|nr:uncharacterized protein AB675_8372 [Phialophora attinorum]KPI44557.1 hypothetical protein AB675_8372 [Phialophora attinorum]